LEAGIYFIRIEEANPISDNRDENGLQIELA
jgi:hypothetical protein